MCLAGALHPEYRRGVNKVSAGQNRHHGQNVEEVGSCARICGSGSVIWHWVSARTEEVLSQAAKRRPFFSLQRWQKLHQSLKESVGSSQVGLKDIFEEEIARNPHLFCGSN